MKKKSISLQSILLYVFFVFYLFFLLENILFKYVSPLELFSPDRYFSRSWNLVPFNDALSYLWKDGLAQGFSELNVYGNILLFIPLGIYLQIFLKKKQVWRSLLAVVGVSVFFEIFQLAFGIGATDIDDVILNTIGGLAGIFIFRLMRLMFKNEKSVRNVVTWLSTAVGSFVLVILVLLRVFN